MPPCSAPRRRSAGLSSGGRRASVGTTAGLRPPSPEDAAQEVRKPERGKKGVRDRPGAKDLREQHVAGKAEEPRKGRRRADEDCGTDE